MFTRPKRISGALIAAAIIIGFSATMAAARSGSPNVARTSHPTTLTKQQQQVQQEQQQKSKQAKQLQNEVKSKSRDNFQQTGKFFGGDSGSGNTARAAKSCLKCY